MSLTLVGKSMSLNRAKQLIKSNYGRDFGWHIEFEGNAVGTLSKPISTEMFWVKYTITPASNSTSEILLNVNNWDQCKFKYRNIKLNEYTNGGISCGIPEGMLENNIIEMRGLYLLPKGLIENIYCTIWSFFK